jgi:hypothetical protein
MAIYAEPRYTLRSLRQITGYFDGLELLRPGVVPNPLWRPDPALHMLGGTECRAARIGRIGCA